MSITCTFGQIDKLRDTPQGPGALSKLARSESLSTVDKFRVSRLIKEIDAKLGDYGKTLVEIAKKYGEAVKINGLDSYQIKPENMPAYSGEKATLDAESCELSANRLPFSSYDIPELTALDLTYLETFIVVPSEDTLPATPTSTSK